MTVQSTTPAPGAVTPAPAAIVTRTKPPKLTWTSGSIGISLVVWGLALLYAAFGQHVPGAALVAGTCAEKAAATAAVVTTLFTVIVSAATGYAFAKYKAWWLKVFFVCILATTMLPTEVIMPSTFVVIRDLGLYDTLAGIIVPSIMTATGTFMFRQYFKTVPDELMEAARIDGASELRIFASIMLPLARPIAITLAIFSFHWRWNDYIWPLLVLKDQKLYTLQVALRSIVGADNIDWSVLLSASVISLVPMVVIFLVFQRYIMNADMNAGLKD